jgi:hypothetical protein
VIYTDQGTIQGPVANQIAAIGTPFAILPGDGAANGMFFTGTAGAFTLNAAILTNAWNALKGELIATERIAEPYGPKKYLLP